MPTLTQEDTVVMVSFRCPAKFKRIVDIELAKRGLSLRDFCIDAMAIALGIPAPGAAEPKKRRTA